MPEYKDKTFMITLLNEQVETAGSMRALAIRLEVSASFICDVLKGRRDVTDRLAELLGYRRIILFEKKGDS